VIDEFGVPVKNPLSTPHAPLEDYLYGDEEDGKILMGFGFVLGDECATDFYMSQQFDEITR
jgi:hypothetical protein